MPNCPKCGANIEDDTVFCHNCGSKVTNGGFSRPNVNTNSFIPNNNDSFEDKKNKTLVIFGYLVIIVELLVIFSALASVRVINGDRLILYPLLCVLLSFYNASLLVQNEKTYIHSIIIVVISVVLLIFGGLIF